MWCPEHYAATWTDRVPTCRDSLTTASGCCTQALMLLREERFAAVVSPCWSLSLQCRAGLLSKTACWAVN
jgi:hypothetical protein